MSHDTETEEAKSDLRARQLKTATLAARKLLDTAHVIPLRLSIVLLVRVEKKT
jgi:hypothetical protein